MKCINGHISGMKSRVPSSRAARSKRDERGATAIEYALLIALVGVVIITGVTLLGSRLSSAFTSAANGLTGATAGGGASDPCAAKTSSGSPAATCTESGGAAVWTCPTGYTVNEGASTVTCTADALPAYSGTVPGSKTNGGDSDGWVENLDVFSGLTYGTPSCSGNSGACAKISYDLSGSGQDVSANSSWRDSDNATVTIPWTATQSGHLDGSGSITVTIS